MWFLLKHVTAPGFDQARQHVTPFRMGMASLAMTSWDQLAGLCTRYGVLVGYDWRAVRQNDFPVYPSVDSLVDGGEGYHEDLGRLFEGLGAR
jgi:hypothetical protein